MQHSILLRRSCTQAAGIRLKICGEMQCKYSQIHKETPFYLSYLPVPFNPSRVIFPAEPKLLTSQKGMLGDLIVLCWILILITIRMVKATGPCPKCNFPSILRGLRNWKMYDIKQLKICAQCRDMLLRPRLFCQVNLDWGLRLRPGSWQTSQRRIV